MKQITKMSPSTKGRIAGACFLAIFVAGEIFSVLVPNLGLLNNNPAATIDSIVSHQIAFWAGYPFFLLVIVFRLILMLLFYELFKPVNKSISLLAVYFNIVASTMQAVMAITLLAPCPAGERALLDRVHSRSGTCTRSRGHAVVQPHLLDRPGVLLLLRPPHRLSRL